MLCIGSPLMVWATSHIERRVLLAGALIAVGLGQLASAVAPSYPLLLALRVLSMAFAALVTPQAASTVALLVPERERAAAIVFVFLGFSLAIAGGLPLVTFISTHAGWHLTFLAIGAAMIANGVLILVVLPGRLHAAAISLQSWAQLLRSRRVLTLLLLTATHVTAQFTVFTYLAPLLIRLAQAGSGAIGLFFLIFGVTGFLGSLIATRLVVTLKPYRRHSRGHGHGACLLGPRLCLDQLHAAGAARHLRAGPRQRLGLAQYVLGLYRPGHRLGARRCAAYGGATARARLCRGDRDGGGVRASHAHARSAGPAGGLLIHFTEMCLGSMAQTVVKPRAKPKLKTARPKLYKVILLNDDYTPREFVVQVLKAVFRMNESQAYRVMMTAHQKGACVIAVYTRDVAETKAKEATELGKENGYPLFFTTEPEE